MSTKFYQLSTGSEKQDGVSSKFMHGMSKSYQQNRAKLKSKVNCTMAQAGKEYIVDPDTESGLISDFRKCAFFRGRQ
mgnify:FL=1